MNPNLRSSPQEVKNWMLSTLKHSCQVEYYLAKLNLDSKDPQRPHDLIGEGNKYSWSVIKGMAIQYRNNTPIFFESYVLPSIKLHRKGQYHHQMWNQQNPKATPEDMKLGAVDSLCSLLEDREYQGGAHTFQQIINIIKKEPPYRVKWFWMVYSSMKKIPSPNTKQIQTLRNFPNIGLPTLMYNRINEHTQEAIQALRKEQGYNL